MTHTTTTASDISLTPAQSSAAARFFLNGAAVAIGGSMVALLPLWNNPAAGHTPLFHLVLFSIALCQTFLIGMSVYASSFVKRCQQKDIETNWLAAVAEGRAALATTHTPRVETAPAVSATWWTDSSVREEVSLRCGR